METWGRRPAFTAALVAGLVCVAPARAWAQAGAVGVGFRVSLVRGDAAVVETADRYSGGFLRARVSPHSGLELALDYRSRVSTDLTERIRDLPVQASWLLYPVRAALAPYLLFGVGWYTQRVDVLTDGVPVESRTARRVGYHAGLGGELHLGRRVGLHGDYRYTFIGLGGEEAGREPGAVPIPGLDGLQRRLRLSHQGSMWTGGVTVYF